MVRVVAGVWVVAEVGVQLGVSLGGKCPGVSCPMTIKHIA